MSDKEDSASKLRRSISEWEFSEGEFKIDRALHELEILERSEKEGIHQFPISLLLWTNMSDLSLAEPPQRTIQSGWKGVELRLANMEDKVEKIDDLEALVQAFEDCCSCVSTSGITGYVLGAGAMAIEKVAQLFGVKSLTGFQIACVQDERIQMLSEAVLLKHLSVVKLSSEMQLAAALGLKAVETMQTNKQLDVIVEACKETE